jgi:hypothetical protein
MRNKNIAYTIVIQTGLSELQLSAFPAIYHKQLPPQMHDLRCGIMSFGRQSRTATQNMHMKTIHRPAGRLKIGVTRRSRKWDYIANIRHAGYKKQQALKAQPKTRVRCRTVATGIQIPVYVFVGNSHFFGPAQ